MKLKLKILYATTGIVALVLGALQSCEHYLEVDPPINQINSTQVFESVSTADAALSNLYMEIQSSSLFSGGAVGSGALLGTYTDDLYCYTMTTQNSDLDLYNNAHVASNTRIKSTWSSAYQEIYLANAVLEGIAKSSAIPEKDKKRIKGETLFLRSLVYFYLSQIFGDIPYTTTTDYNVNQSLYKTPEADLLMKIKIDLEESINLMDDLYRNAERIYPNRKTAELILANVLMTQHEWSAAENLLKGIVQNSLYEWQPDLSKTFKMSGKHILWQLKPLKAANATSEAQLYYFNTSLPTTYSLSNDLIAVYSSNDLRKQLWIKELIINQKSYYRADKYRNIVGNTDEYSIVFRLEEAYLLLAESLVQQNKLSAALPYLNAIKQKAGVTPAAENSSKEQLLNEILNENRKEFFTEKGIRFMSLKRAGRLNDLVLSKPSWKDYHQRWPVPISELIINPHLNPQNNGY